ncbi:MAG: cupin domain-containing protein [Ardenticatenaceae bacterium]
MYFHDSKEHEPKQILPGVFLRAFFGEQMTLAVIDMEANGVVPLHSHVHEQVGMIIEGVAELTVAGETRQTQPGDVYTIPGDVVHGVTAGDQPVKLVEVFYPTREEFR